MNAMMGGGERERGRDGGEAERERVRGGEEGEGGEMVVGFGGRSEMGDGG